MRKHCSARGRAAALVAREGPAWRRRGDSSGSELNSIHTRCLQELKPSAGAAHVFCVCAYFPNLDMGSELQALRAFAKLAATFLLPESGCGSAQGCSPLLGLLAAEILCLWGQPGQRVPWHSSRCLRKGVAEGRRKAAVQPLCCCWKMAGTQVALLGELYCSALSICLGNSCL